MSKANLRQHNVALAGLPQVQHRVGVERAKRDWLDELKVPATGLVVGGFQLLQRQVQMLATLQTVTGGIEVSKAYELRGA